MRKIIAIFIMISLLLGTCHSLAEVKVSHLTSGYPDTLLEKINEHFGKEYQEYVSERGRFSIIIPKGTQIYDDLTSESIHLYHMSKNDNLEDFITLNWSGGVDKEATVDLVAQLDSDTFICGGFIEIGSNKYAYGGIKLSSGDYAPTYFFLDGFGNSFCYTLAFKTRPTGINNKMFSSQDLVIMLASFYSFSMEPPESIIDIVDNANLPITFNNI